MVQTPALRLLLTVFLVSLLVKYKRAITCSPPSANITARAFKKMKEKEKKKKEGDIKPAKKISRDLSIKKDIY